MGVELNDLTRDRERTVQVSLPGGGSLGVRYRPSAYTSELELALGKSNDARQFVAGAAAGIVALVTWWDITENGQPYPVTPESVDALGFLVNKAIMDAITGDIIDASTKKGSAGG